MIELSLSLPPLLSMFFLLLKQKLYDLERTLNSSLNTIKNVAVDSIDHSIPIFIWALSASQHPNLFYGSNKNKVSLPYIMSEEFLKELARQLARLHFNLGSSIQPKCCWQQDLLVNTDLARKCNH